MESNIVEIMNEYVQMQIAALCIKPCLPNFCLATAAQHDFNSDAVNFINHKMLTFVLAFFYTWL
jgi:hypothetical protein